MNKIIRKQALNPTVTLMEVEAPLVARKAEPGQFIILRADENGERIPLTVADYDRERGTVTIIFQIVGAATETLNHLPEGGYIHDFVGPLGRPTHTEGLKKVAVVGGGDTACEEANYLAGLCEKVYMIVRKPYLRASEIMQQRVLNNPKIEVLFEHNTVQLTGEGKVQGADLVFRKGEPDEAMKHIAIDGFFLAIGHHPNTELFKDFIARDAEGYIITEGHSTQCYQMVNGKCTNGKLDGIFAAGDCADPHYRQAIVAAGSGAKAAIEADKYIKSL